MTLKDAFARIGQPALVTFATVQIPVTILDARPAFGRVDLHVAPIGGSGTVWVNADAVTFTGA